MRLKDLKSIFKIVAFILSATIVSLLIKQVGFLSLLLFPGILLFTINKQNFFLSLPVATSFSLITTMINAVLLDNLNLPVTLPALIILLATEALIISLFKVKKFNLEVSPKNRKYFFAIYAIFILAIISRLLSVYDVLVPVLHDPQAHAFWAKKIAIENSIDYFYSPGLHIWSWLTSEAFGLSFARSTHLVTNFFSAFTIPTWAFMAYVISSKARLATWVALAALVSPLPQLLFLTSGKNSLVMAVPFMALSMLFAHLFLEKKSVIRFIVLSVLLVGTGLIHYPVFGVTIGAISLYIFAHHIDKWSVKTFNIPYLKKVLSSLLPILLSLCLIGINILLTVNESPKTEHVSSRIEARAYHDLARTTKEVPDYDKNNIVIPEEYKSETAQSGLVGGLREFKAQYLSRLTNTHKQIGIILLSASIVGVYYLFAYAEKDKNLSAYKLALQYTIIAALLIAYVIIALPIKGLATTKDAAFVIMPMIMLLPVALLMYKASSNRGLELATIIIVGLLACATYFSLFNINSEPMVNKYDLAAFEWINDNLDESEKFIGYSWLPQAKSSAIFAIDGSLWLPVFTNNNTATPFMEFSSITNHVNYEYSVRLGSHEPSVVNQAVNYFKNNGYNYIYVDGDHLFNELGIENVLEQNLGKIVYENEEVKIVEIQKQ